MAKLTFPMKIPQFAINDWEKQMKWYEDLEKRLREVSRNLKEGEYKGAFLAFPVADGHAYYVVTKARPLTLQHVPVWDGWEIPAAHVRGLTLDDVKFQLEYEAKLDALFGAR